MLAYKLLMNYDFELAKNATHFVNLAEPNKDAIFAANKSAIALKGGVVYIHDPKRCDFYVKLRNVPGFINENISQISASESHFLILKEGIVYSYGENNFGQLGTGDYISLPVIAKVVDTPDFQNKNITAISAGKYHSLLIKDEGHKRGVVYSCGKNGDYQLGLNTNRKKNTFTKVVDSFFFCNENVTSIEAGNVTSYLLKDGAVYSCGKNNYGQLGITFNVKVKIFTKAVDAPYFENKNITKISAKEDHSVIIKDGEAYSCGRNSFGQLGIGNQVDSCIFTKIVDTDDFENKNVTSIFTNSYSSFLIKEGVAYCCGNNVNGVLGIRNNGVDVFTKVVSTPSFQNENITTIFINERKANFLKYKRIYFCNNLYFFDNNCFNNIPDLNAQIRLPKSFIGLTTYDPTCNVINLYPYQIQMRIPPGHQIQMHHIIPRR